jgi:hypothetical protein
MTRGRPAGAPSVSVVVNTYNYGRFLGRAIDSALGQTHPPLEVIVVDDGSTDDSGAVIASYGERIVPIMKANGGQASAFNAGFAASRGDVVLFLDADDYLYDDAVERIVASWAPDLAKAHSALDLVDADGRPQGATLPAAEDPLDGGDVVPKILAHGRYVSPVTSGNAFSRAALDAVLPMPEDEYRIAADGYLVNIVPFHGRVRVIDRPLGAYRMHLSNHWSRPMAGGERPGLLLRSALDTELLRALVHHQHVTHLHVAREARARGLRVPRDLGTRDWIALRARLASLRLDPARHPLPGDRAVTLAAHGVRSVLRYAPLGPRRQSAVAAWFLLVGVLPPQLARLGIAWVFAPEALAAPARRTLEEVRGRVLPAPPRAGRNGKPAARPLRVEIACPGLGRVRRGYETFAQELYDAVRTVDGVDVRLAKGGPSSGAGEFRVPSLSRDSALAGLVERATGRSRYFAEQLTFAASYLARSPADDPDVVFVSDWGVAMVLSHVRRSLRRRFRIVFSNGGGVPPPFPRFDHVHQPSRHFLDQATAAGQPTAGQTYIPYGFTFEWWEEPTAEERRSLRAQLGLPIDAPIVLSVGALNRSQKRHDHVVRACAALAPRPHLVLLGQVEPETAGLRSLADTALGPAGYTMRMVEPREVPRYYDAADVFALASLHEGFGRVLIEAGSRGLRCIVHDHPVMREVLGSWGRYVDMTHPAALVEAIDRALADGPLRGDDVEAQRAALIGRYAWDALRDEYVAMFARCASGHTG